jgi:hypothetical protein
MPLWLVSLLRSKWLWGSIAAALLVWGAHHTLDARYAAGLKDGRAECRQSITSAQMAELERLRKDADDRAAKEALRADAAEAALTGRQTDIKAVGDIVRRQLNANQECLSQEAADAIRAIR